MDEEEEESSPTKPEICRMREIFMAIVCQHVRNRLNWNPSILAWKAANGGGRGRLPPPLNLGEILKGTFP